MNNQVSTTSEKPVAEDHKVSWLSTEWISWNKYSETVLRSIEKKIFDYVKTPYRGWYADVGPVVGPADKIWTIALNTNSGNTPIVLLHGLGAGVGFWCLNLDSFAETRPVYAMDLLGFGRSTRPRFSKHSLEAERQMVDALEAWRQELNLDSFILLGHSLGGFLAASYAISYPNRVKHLILADPWGFPERPAEMPNIPLWVKVISYSFQPFNPLFAVRAVGPFGQWLVNKIRPDLNRKFSHLIEEDDLIGKYLYQCNAQTPSGEGAFHAMMSGFGWAKHPMANRINNLREDVPITLMYGSRSWVDNTAAQVIKDKRMGSYVHSQIIAGAGHHVYADKPELFNRYVLEACALADQFPGGKLAITYNSDEVSKPKREEDAEPKPISNM